jgi:transposase
MRDTDLFQLALGLVPPWLVKEARFDAEKKRLDIEIDFTRGGRFVCSGCGKPDCVVHDTVTKTWRHLDFFQHQAYLTARVARTKCDDCGVRLAEVPWARPGSGFTLLFEALVMTLVAAMPVNAAARIVGEHDTRLWRIIIHYVEAALARADFSTVTRVAVDETAAKRGHNYITLFVDIDRRRVLHVADGKDAATVEAFADDLAAHGGKAENIAEVCIDMSAAFIRGVGEHLPEAAITFDKFHAVKLVNDAVDEVRRAEVKERPELRRTRYVWLKNERNLSAGQSQQLGSLCRTNLKTARAYQLRLAFQDMYAEPTRWWAEHVLDRWLSWAMRCRLEPMKAAARTIRKHRQGILRWFDSRIANGLIEGINSLVQAAKAKARGYRTIANLKAMVYILAGKLDLRLPT